MLPLALPALAAPQSGRWVGTWAASPQLAEPGNQPPLPSLAGATVRQVIRVSTGGRQIRLRFSNAFGKAPLVIAATAVAQSAGGGAIGPASSRSVFFAGSPAVTIPEGALVISDALDFDLAPLEQLAITIHLRDCPREITAHPGARETSYFEPGGSVSDPTLAGAPTAEHWYYINGIDVLSPSGSALVVLGDSITDGRGSTTNGNNRWPDQLAARLAANPASRGVGVLNEGIGGNRLLRDGLGPNTLARFDRDVLAQTGVRKVILLEGINDLGTAVAARAHGEPGATAGDIIAADQQLILRAHAHGIRTYGATLTPFEGFKSYDVPRAQQDREAINQWIRTSGQFDGVIDFDAILRDPAHPLRLQQWADSGDHLHPSVAGYRAMAQAIDLGWFAEEGR